MENISPLMGEIPVGISRMKWTHHLMDNICAELRSSI